MISNRDAADPTRSHWALDYGTFLLKSEGSMMPLATPCWDWSRFYIQIVRSIFNGSYDELAKAQSDQAINYWWGMNGGLIDVQLSPGLPEGIRRLAEHLRNDLRGGYFDPFGCRIKDQNGALRNDGTVPIMRMDWLCENVDGHIPEIYELRPEAVETTKILALHPESLEEKDDQP